MTTPMTSAIPLVVTVSPHPDDEVLGIGATLASLLDAGWSMLNLACSLGHEEDYERRRGELEEAGRRLGFTSIVMEPLAPISRVDNPTVAAVIVADAVEALVREHQPAVVVSPHRGDGHHGHEMVAHGVAAALERVGAGGPRWWSYGIWRDLPTPNVYVPYGHRRMGQMREVIAAYAGENDRSAYDEMYPARAVVNRTLGSERVFGFGTATASVDPFADLFTEAWIADGGWQVPPPRIFDAMQETLLSRLGTRPSELSA